MAAGTGTLDTAAGKNTPFLGIDLPGKVRYTLLQGQVVYEAAIS